VTITVAHQPTILCYCRRALPDKHHCSCRYCPRSGTATKTTHHLPSICRHEILDSAPDSQTQSTSCRITTIILQLPNDQIRPCEIIPLVNSRYLIHWYGVLGRLSILRSSVSLLPSYLPPALLLVSPHSPLFASHSSAVRTLLLIHQLTRASGADKKTYRIQT
jgi:hypothetical protein